MTNCAEAWAGDWGDAYTARNRVDWRARIPFWRDILDRTAARSVYEFGCNAGWNLSAILAAGFSGAGNGLVPQVAGCEVNTNAYCQAVTAGLNVVCAPILGETRHSYGSDYDLAFTAGVLIHVPPTELKDTMLQVVRASADHVLAIEYASDKEEEVEYRGQKGMLWRRPYGRLYQDMGLTLVDSGDAGPGFDRCTYWLLRK